MSVASCISREISLQLPQATQIAPLHKLPLQLYSVPHDYTYWSIQEQHNEHLMCVCHRVCVCVCVCVCVMRP